MIAALTLLVFAAVVALLARRILPGAGWTRRAPRLGVIAWQTASLTVPVSVLLAGVALALPLVPTASGDLAGLLGACEFMLREHYETPGGALVHLLGIAGAAALLGRLVYSLLVEFAAIRRERQGQRARISLVGRQGVVPGAWLVDDHRPAVFCIPGPGARIVVTTGALSVLSGRQRSVALAHERAHLAGRHHLALAVAAVLRRAMPRIGFFAIAETEIATLVEMHADDRATIAGGRRDLATALVALAQGPRPAGAMSTNGGAAVQRVQRLIGNSPVLPTSQRWSIRLVTAAVLVAPVLIAVAPAIETALLDYCAVALHA